MLIKNEKRLAKVAVKLKCEATEVRRAVKGLIRIRCSLATQVESSQSVRDAELQRLREELEEHKRRLVELEGTHQKKADIPGGNPRDNGGYGYRANPTFSEWLAQHDKQEGISKRELQLYTDQEIGGKRYVCYSNGEWKEWK